EADEKQRLANAYRLELARIKQEPSLINTAPPALLTRLREHTTKLQAVLDRHELALDAVKAVAEGLVQAMAEEGGRLRSGARGVCSGAGGYGARGRVEANTGPSPAVLDRQA